MSVKHKPNPNQNPASPEHLAYLKKIKQRKAAAAALEFETAARLRDQIMELRKKQKTGETNE